MFLYTFLDNLFPLELDLPDFLPGGLKIEGMDVKASPLRTHLQARKKCMHSDTDDLQNEVGRILEKRGCGIVDGRQSSLL